MHAYNIKEIITEAHVYDELLNLQLLWMDEYIATCSYISTNNIQNNSRFFI